MRDGRPWRLKIAPWPQKPFTKLKAPFFKRQNRCQRSGPFLSNLTRLNLR
jgi:hypothetical protein